jgi:hypothetical protein
MAAYNIQDRLGIKIQSSTDPFQATGRVKTPLRSASELVSLHSSIGNTGRTRINSGILTKLLDGITNIFNEFGEWGDTEDGKKVKSELASLYKSFAENGGQVTPPKRRSDKIEKVYVDPDGNKFHIVVIPYDDEEGTSDIVINLNRFNDISNDKIEETVLDYIDNYSEKGGETKENEKEEILYTPGSRGKNKKSESKPTMTPNAKLGSPITGSLEKISGLKDFHETDFAVGSSVFSGGEVKTVINPSENYDSTEVAKMFREKFKGGVGEFLKDEGDRLILHGTATGKDGNFIYKFDSFQENSDETSVESSAKSVGKTRILASTRVQSARQREDRTGYCFRCYDRLSKQLGYLKNIIEIYPKDDDEDLVCKECGEGEWDHLIQAVNSAAKIQSARQAVTVFGEGEFTNHEVIKGKSRINSVNPGTTTNTGEPGLWELVSDIKNLKDVVLDSNRRMPVTSMETFESTFNAHNGSGGELIFNIRDSVKIPYRVEEAFRETVGYEVRRVLEDNGMLDAGTGNFAHAPILNEVDVRGSIVGDGGQVMWVIDSILAHEEGTPHGQPINSGHAGLPRGAAGYGEHDYGDLIEESARKSKDRSKLLVGRPWSYSGASGYEILTPPNWADSIANLNFFRQETGYKAEGSGFSDSFRVKTGRITPESFSALKQVVDNFNRGEFE